MSDDDIILRQDGKDYFLTDKERDMVVNALKELECLYCPFDYEDNGRCNFQCDIVKERLSEKTEVRK